MPRRRARDRRVAPDRARHGREPVRSGRHQLERERGCRRRGGARRVAAGRHPDGATRNSVRVAASGGVPARAGCPNRTHAGFAVSGRAAAACSQSRSSGHRRDRLDTRSLARIRAVDAQRESVGNGRGSRERDSLLRTTLERVGGRAAIRTPASGGHRRHRLRGDRRRHTLVAAGHQRPSRQSRASPPALALLDRHPSTAGARSAPRTRDRWSGRRRRRLQHVVRLRRSGVRGARQRRSGRRSRTIAAPPLPVCCASITSSSGCPASRSRRPRGSRSSDRITIR